MPRLARKPGRKVVERTVASAAPVIRLSDPGRMRVTLRRLGREKNPLLVVDDVLANAEEIREHALGSAFSNPRRMASKYPGYTSYCTLRGMTELARWASRLLWTKAYGLDADDESAMLDSIQTDAFFAITAPASDRKYFNVHTDGGQWMAMVLYLTPGQEELSGTGFWRHVPTGMESAYQGPDAMRRIASLDELFGLGLAERTRKALAASSAASYDDWSHDTFANMHASPFPEDDHGDWKRIGAVAARFNRLVAYPSWQFHSITMKPGWTPGSLSTARLSLNGMVHHPALEPIAGGVPLATIPGLEA